MKKRLGAVSARMIDHAVGSANNNNSKLIQRHLNQLYGISSWTDASEEWHDILHNSVEEEKKRDLETLGGTC